jgi:GNAT superfamily N-acetyltransferase
MALCYRDDPAARSGYHVYDDGIVRGFARWHAETETGWLDQLFVDEAFRCRGIGEALLESFRMEMHRQGIRCHREKQAHHHKCQQKR